MYIVSFTSAIAVLLVFLESKRKISFGFGMAFLLVTFVQAIHYNYGNDYSAYMLNFNLFTYKPFSFKYLFEYLSYRDPLWPVFCYLFKPIGFFGMVAFLAIFQSSVYFYFIKKYVPEEWLALGVFIYLFTPDIYMLNMSMLRQGFVEAIFLLAFIVAQKKTVWHFVVALVLMLGAGQIHSSANIFTPFLLWTFIPMKDARWVAVAMVGLFAVVQVLGNFAQNVMTFFLQMQMFERFEQYQGVGSGGMGLGYLIMSIPAVVILLYLKDSQNESLNKVVSMALCERFMVAFSTVVMLAGRLTTFFAIFYMVAIPVSYSKIRDENWKYGLVAIYVVISLYSYWFFLNSETYAKYYQTFHTIFEVVFE